MWKELCWLGLAGAAGTLSRFTVAGLLQSLAGERFPAGTLAVNLIGCFLFGLIWSLADERLIISGHTRFIILTGFMGAFTTFSTFGFETAELLRRAEWWQAAGNMLINNAGGIAGVFLGWGAGRWL